MKRVFSCLMIIFSLFTFINVKAVDIDISSKEAIIYNLNDNVVLYEKNSNEITYVASLTKIMTAFIAIENIDDLDSTVIVQTSDLTGIEGYAKAGFKVGDNVSYRDLLYGLMLSSGADSANIIANNIAGTPSLFVNMMNDKVKKLGLKNTNFSNPIGMDLNNYSTAYDMAIILKEALKSDVFKELFNSTFYITTNGLELEKTTQKTAAKYNLDISSITGSKTGYTDLANYCLASTAYLNNVSYLAITLNASDIPSHIKDTLTLYDYYSSNYAYRKILNKGQLLTTLKVKGSRVKDYEVFSSKNIEKYLSNDIDLNNIEYRYEGITLLTSKIKKGDYLGKVEIIYDNETLDTYEVYLTENIKYWNYFLLLIPLVIILIIIFICKFILKKRKKKKKKKNAKNNGQIIIDVL